jgi:hypothetical protein
MSTAMSAQPTDDPPTRVRVTYLCHACGITNHDAPATSFVYRSGASFCFTCWETLPGSAIRRVIQEVVLRGVPLS